MSGRDGRGGRGGRKAAAVDLELLREAAVFATKHFNHERLMVLCEEMETLGRMLQAGGSSQEDIAAAKLRHAADPEAGKWDASFVRRLVRMYRPEFGVSILLGVPGAELLEAMELERQGAPS